MKRQMQANEIRTNMVFEFAVVGEQNVRALFSMIMDQIDNCTKDKVNARLVGVSLKKPTANGVYLTKHTIALSVDKTSKLEEISSELDEDYVDEQPTLAESDEEEEVEADDDDKESDRND